MRRVFAGLAAVAMATLLAPPAIAAPSDTIKIGMVNPLTGSAANSGHLAVQGAQLAVDEVNAAGGVMGKKLELVVEDDQTSNAGAVAAFSKLTSEGGIAAILGPIRSTEVQAMTPDIEKAKLPVMIGGTSPILTHENDPWVFRARPNDTYSARVISTFAIGDLHLKKVAVIYSTDAFGSAGGKLVSEALQKNGSAVATTQAYPNHTQDFTPVVLAVKQSGADGIVTYCTFENDLAVLARQLRQLGVTVPWVGSPSITDVASLQLAGPALYGTYGIADFVADSSPAAKEFTSKFQAKYHGDPDVDASWTFDAVNVLATAMRTAKSTDPTAVRNAILKIKGYHGVEGVYDFDQNGDGLHGYNIIKNDHGKIVFMKHIDFKD